MHPLLRKLLSPVGFLFVALCFLLPFVAASCQSPDLGSNSVSYTGADLASRGWPEVDVSRQVHERFPGVTYADVETRQNPSPVPVQSLLAAALVVAVAGIAVAALRRPWPRALAATGTSLITAILLTGGEVIALHTVRRKLEPTAADILGGAGANPSPGAFDVHPRYGFWLALLLAIALAVANAVALLRLSRGTQAQPEQASTLSPSG